MNAICLPIQVKMRIIGKKNEKKLAIKRMSEKYQSSEMNLMRLNSLEVQSKLSANVVKISYLLVTEK